MVKQPLLFQVFCVLFKCFFRSCVGLFTIIDFIDKQQFIDYVAQNDAFLRLPLLHVTQAHNTRLPVCYVARTIFLEIAVMWSNFFSNSRVHWLKTWFSLQAFFVWNLWHDVTLLSYTLIPQSYSERLHRNPPPFRVT